MKNHECKPKKCLVLEGKTFCFGEDLNAERPCNKIKTIKLSFTQKAIFDHAPWKVTLIVIV